MRRTARLTTLLGVLAAVAAGSLAGASTAALRAPSGLHGFLLTADEAPTATFHRTPSFAWKPVSGAMRYELQLSTTPDFQDNGLLYDAANIQTPVAAPTLTLPWITGLPHSLYARVRASFGRGRVSPWSAPYGFDVVPPGAPVPLSGAPGLIRWATVDGADAYEVWLVDKVPADRQIEVVRTNVLDERDFYGSSWPASVRWRVRAMRVDVLGPLNGMPVATYGPWSAIYTANNTAPVAAPITLSGTLSDTFSDGTPGSSAHALMPSFLWSGAATLDDTTASFFRVYVFTDSSCVNAVYASPAIASPAYAPRLTGLDLPITQGGANTILDPGQETIDTAFDGQVVIANEQLSPAKPTTSLGSGGTALQAAAVVGSPIDLWDVNWPGGGYYWTVVGVMEMSSGRYQDLELPQDVCAAGRVARLGISSAPSLTRAHQPFATGLSPKGKLVSAAQTKAFYGQPLVAWTAAPAASVYEVQWSRTRYPFAPRGARLTYSTSTVLPLKPGTWWYRVRGYDYNLPTGAQAMAWSAPTSLVVAAPKFRVVRASRH